MAEAVFEMPWQAVAIVFAGIFAAVVAVIGHWVTSSNEKLQARLTSNVKLAEFRQAWLNSLRDDMAAFQALG